MAEKRLKPLMFAGTGSDVGKSILVTAICRILKQDGYSPAPFKAQNMSLNSYATPDALEIGRAQAVQAEAAGVKCCTDMNPLLLKPNSDLTSQIVLNGKPIGNSSARDFFRKEGKDKLRAEVNRAFDRLAAQYNPIIMEGAGSISEMNLIDLDLVNMPMARHADANIILVADIDRGGVFASVYGSVMLHKPEDRKRIKGVIINKFRGDISLFESGKKIIEETSGIKVVGIIPYFKDIYIEEEDSVSLDKKNRVHTSSKVNIAVVLLSHLSNFTDFNRLEQDSRINLYYTDSPTEIAKADIVIVPGSKNTIRDLYTLREKGIDEAIYHCKEQGKSIIGICGGYQMLGLTIEDPNGVESNIEKIDGLGILPVNTILGEKKITRQRDFLYMDNKKICSGYEIHMGNTFMPQSKTYQYATTFPDGTHDGIIVDGKHIGTYLHGILDNEAVLEHILSPYLGHIDIKDYNDFKQEQYNKLASLVRDNLDMDLFYKILNSND